MRVAYAFLADWAVQTRGAKFDVTGGGLDTIQAPEFPALQPRMALVCRVEASPLECGYTHTLRIELIGPDGQRVVPTSELVFTPQQPAGEPHRPAGLTVIGTLTEVVFHAAGDYAFHMLVDNIELSVVPLYLRGRAR